MPGARAVIVDTGLANMASVRAAFERLGVETSVTLDPAAIECAELVVLPGVGSFGAGMARLREGGLKGVLRDRINRDGATLAVCLGMQLLCARSEESPGVAGLSMVDATVRRFPAGVRTPQMGWNRVVSQLPAPFQRSGSWAYFANSYRVAESSPGWQVAWTDYGGRFVSAMRRGRVLACQFHPELSGAWGESLLARWVAAARGEAPAC